MEAGGHIDCLYVSKNDQRRGIASALFADASKVALKDGCKKIDVAASIPAKGFFERNGFEVVVQKMVKINGQNFVNYLMYGQPMF